MTTTNTTINQSGLLPNTAYTVWVRGIDSAGNPSDWSQAFPFTTVRDTVAPGDPTNLAADFTASSINVTWNPPLQVPADFQDYQITFAKSDGTLPVSFFTVNPRFTFTLQDNINAFSTAQSIVDITVKSRDKSGNLSAGATLDNVTNAAPTVSPTISVSPLTGSYSVAVTSTNAPSDFASVEILQYAALTGGSGTSKWKGTDSTAVITATAGTAVYVTARYVDAFGQAGPETAPRVSVTPTAATSIDTTPPAAPTVLNLTAAADTLDPTGATGSVTLTWTAPTDSDLAGYEIAYGTAAGTLNRYVTIGKVTSARIDKLNSGTTYYFGIKSFDTSNNFSTSSLTGNILVPIDSTAPNAPAAPTANRNATKILITHTLNDSSGTARLPIDTAALDIHISDTSTFTPSYASGSTTLFQKIPVTVTASNSYVGTFDYPDGNSPLATRYMKVIAVDKAGNSSTASASATIGTTLSLPIFAPSITVGDAQIGSLSANKLVADTAIANNLKVTSILTVGDAGNDGYIQSADWVSNTTGWRIGHTGSNYALEINNGTIKAGALQLQTASNMLRMEHSVFNKPGTGDSLLTSSLTTKALLYGSNIASATVIEDTTANPAGNYALQLTASSGTTPNVRFTPYDAVTDATKHYLTLVKGESYIISGWFKADTTRSCSFTLYDGTTTADASITGDAAGTTFNATTTWTRFSQVISWSPSTGAAGDVFIGSLILKIPSSSVVYVKGLQLERKIGTVNLPSNYVIPGGTVISGSSIRTGSISSSNYSTGSTGWAIDLSGNSEFNNITARGTIEAQSGNFQSGYIGGTTQGWRVSSNTISNNLIGFYAPLSSRRTNLVINSQFQYDASGATTITGWTAAANTTFSADATALLAKFGTIALRMKSTGTNDIIATSSAFIPVTPGSTYTLSAYLKSSAGKTANVQITWYDQAQTLISTYAPTGVASTTNWTRYTASQAAPSNAVYAKVGIKFASAISTESHYVDGVLFEEGSSALTYFDGSSYEGAWNGVAHNSTSIKYSDDVRSNLILNPSFQNATATTGYTKSATISAIAADTVIYKYGTQSLKATAGTSSVVGDQHISFDYVTVTPGETYTFSFWVYTPTTNTAATGFYAQILPYDINSTLVTGTVTGSTVTPARGVWARATASITIPADTTIVKVIPRLVSAAQLASNQLFYTDGWLLEESSTLRDYFDASLYAYANWSGTTNNSISTMNETAIYVGGTDRNNSSFMVNYDGSMYATRGKIGADLSNSWNIGSGNIYYSSSQNNNLLLNYDPSFEELSTAGNLYWTATYTLGATTNLAASKYIDSYYGCYSGVNAMSVGKFMTPGATGSPSGWTSTDKEYAVRLYKTGATKLSIGPTGDIPSLTASGPISFSAYVKAADVYSRGLASVAASTPAAGSATYTISSEFNNTLVHSFNTGDVVDITGFSIAGYNGRFTVTAVTANTFTVTNATTGAATVTSARATLKPTATVSVECWNGATQLTTVTLAAATGVEINTSTFTKVNVYGTIPANTTNIVPTITTNNRDISEGVDASLSSGEDFYAFTVDLVQLQAVNASTDTDVLYPISYYLRTDGKESPLDISMSGTPIFKVFSSGAAQLKSSITLGTPRVTKSMTINQNTILPRNSDGTVGTVSVTGTLTATTKSFDIIHPTKENMRLRYGSLEGPENGVYLRGKSSSASIILPEYWSNLVDENSITVQITPIGQSSDIFVESFSINEIIVGGTFSEFFYLIQGERKDVPKLTVEYSTIA